MNRIPNPLSTSTPTFSIDSSAPDPKVSPDSSSSYQSVPTKASQSPGGSRAALSLIASAIGLSISIVVIQLCRCEYILIIVNHLISSCPFIVDLVLLGLPSGCPTPDSKDYLMAVWIYFDCRDLCYMRYLGGD